MVSWVIAIKSIWVYSDDMYHGSPQQKGLSCWPRVQWMHTLCFSTRTLFEHMQPWGLLWKKHIAEYLRLLKCEKSLKCLRSSHCFLWCSLHTPTKRLPGDWTLMSSDITSPSALVKGVITCWCLYASVLVQSRNAHRLIMLIHKMMSLYFTWAERNVHRSLMNPEALFVPSWLQSFCGRKNASLNAQH